MELAVLGQRLPLDAHQPIEVHAFGLEPGFQGLARVRAEFHEHFPFQHINQHALGVRRAAVLHALREIFRALAGEASERVLREIARHESSRVEVQILSIPYRAEVRTAQGTSRGSWCLNSCVPERALFSAGHTTRLQTFRICIGNVVIFDRGGGPMKKIVHALYVCLLVCNFSKAQTKSAGVAPESEAAAKEVRGDNAESVAKLPVRRVV